MDFLRLIEKHRTVEKQLAWEGTFKDYLDIVKVKPSVCQLAHARIYNMINSHFIFYKIQLLSKLWISNTGYCFFTI